MDVDAGNVKTIFVVSAVNALERRDDATFTTSVPLIRVNAIALGEMYTLFVSQLVPVDIMWKQYRYL